MKSMMQAKSTTPKVSQLVQDKSKNIDKQTSQLVQDKSTVKSTVKSTTVVNKSEILNGINNDWLSLLDTNALQDILNSTVGPKTTPPKNNIFEFAKLTQLDKIKVVIIGQDPYPKAGDAHGLAFSCLTHTPGSLNNIYKCLLKSKLINEMPDTGNLEHWAAQGVLLLNTALTTQIGKPNAHSDIWREYVIDIIEKISSLRPIVFMLWGNYAKSMSQYLSDKSVILEWAHPSPLAQSKQSFIQCPHFLEANKILVKLGHLPIDWNVSEQKSEIEMSFDCGPKTQVVFTDGSCHPNKKCKESRAGYAASVALGTLKDTIIYGKIDCQTVFATSQRAEGTAIIKVLEFMKSKWDEWDKLIIVSDSEFWIKMITNYIPGWVRKGIAFTERENPDLVEELWNLYSDLTDGDVKSVELRHMKSHNKEGWGGYDEGTYERFCHDNNKYVDELAEFARLELPVNKHVVAVAEYDE